MSRYLDPTNDVAFKRVFSDKEILMDFLNNILHLEEGYKIIDLNFVSNEEIPNIGHGKRSLFDIKVKNQLGHYYIVEMQNSAESGFLNRVQLYASHSYTSQILRGEVGYQGMVPVVVVVIVKKTLFPEEVACISFHHTKEQETGNQYLRALSYVFVELGKFHKNEEQLATIEDFWLNYLLTSESTKSQPANITDKQIIRAYEAIARFNWSEDQFDAYLRSSLAIDAEETRLSDSHKRGKEEGEVIGIAKGIAEAEAKAKIKEKNKMISIARDLLKKGLEVKSVAETTGLTEEEVGELR